LSIQLSPFYCSSVLQRIDWPASVLQGRRAASKRRRSRTQHLRKSARCGDLAKCMWKSRRQHGRRRP